MAETPKPTPAQVAAGQARAGGTAPVVSTPKKKNKTKNKTKTSKQLVEYISSDLNTSGLPKGSTISKEKGLTDVGLGTPIRVGEGFRIPFNQPTVTYKYTQYKKGSAQMHWQTLSNDARASLLLSLSAIPGLYKESQKLTQQQISNYYATRIIPLREEDVAAIENVMRFADTVGQDINQSVSYLASNPVVAKQFFDTAGLRTPGKKVVLTPGDILALEIGQTFQDYLDSKVDKKAIDAYVKKVNDLEINRGGRLLDAERNAIMLDIIQTKAQEIFKDDQSPDSLVMQRGALGGAYNTLRKVYRDYGVVVDDKTVYKQAIQAIRSQQAMENTIQKIQVQAQVAFPALEKYYQQGLSTREALTNHIGLFSKIYNVPENDVDLSKIYPAIKGDKLASLDEWKTYLYSLPEFQKTDLFRQRSSNDAMVLMRNFFGGI